MAGIRASFPYVAKWHPIVWPDHISCWWSLELFLLLAVVNGAAVNTRVRVFL